MWLYAARHFKKESTVTKPPDHPARALLPERLVAERYGVCTRTIDRWGKDPAVGFPPLVVIRKRRYRDLAQLDRWDAARRGGAA
jgi:hypothetical protein